MTFRTNLLGGQCSSFLFHLPTTGRGIKNLDEWVEVASEIHEAQGVERAILDDCAAWTTQAALKSQAWRGVRGAGRKLGRALMNTCEKYGYKLAEAGKLLRVEEDVFVPIRTPMSTLRWRRRYGRYLPE